MAQTQDGDFAPGFVARPFWTADAPLPEVPRTPLPAAVDVAVIGGGYTGLAAATELARAGRSVLVLEAGDLGAGCSAKNGGQVGTSIKPGLAVLAGRHGADLAFRIRREGIDALAGLRQLVVEDGLDADWRPVGRFYAAHSQAMFESMAKAASVQPKGLEVDAEIIPRAEQHRVLGSERYFGGVLHGQVAAVHPARLLASLYRRAVASGVTVATGAAVSAIIRDGAGFALETVRGRVAARDVLVATNGYTGPLTPWHRRRIIPISSAMLATAPLDPALVDRLVPEGRMVTDSRKLVLYFRPSPDGRRLLFGGRAAVFDISPERAVPRLLALYRRVFPEAAGFRAAFGWTGTVAYTFDELPHLGRHDGVHFCLGYCGSGVSLSVHFGRRIAWQMLGRADGRTALDGLAFPSRPWHFGPPWFLAPAIAALRLADRVGL